jgi:hypothetical protein
MVHVNDRQGVITPPKHPNQGFVFTKLSICISYKIYKIDYSLYYPNQNIVFGHHTGKDPHDDQGLLGER